MLSGDDLRIGRIVFELDVESRPGAAALQDQISTLYRNRIHGLLEETIRRKLPTELLFSADRLELSLPPILAAELADKLPDQIAVAFSELLGRLANGESQGSEQRFSITPLSGGRLERLRYFLRNGVFPWWDVPQTNALLQDTIRELIREQPGSFRDLILLEGRSEAVRRRLAMQLQPESLRLLIGALEPADAAFIVDFHSELAAAHAREPLAKSSPPEFVTELWVIMLRILIDATGSEFSRLEFTKSSFRQLAARFNVSYHELVDLVMGALEKKRPDTGFSSFRTLLEDLVSADGLQRSDLPSEKENASDAAAAISYFIKHGRPGHAAESLGLGEFGAMFTAWLRSAPPNETAILARGNPYRLAELLQGLSNGEALLEMILGIRLQIKFDAETRRLLHGLLAAAAAISGIAARVELIRLLLQFRGAQSGQRFETIVAVVVSCYDTRHGRQGDNGLRAALKDVLRVEPEPSDVLHSIVDPQPASENRNTAHFIRYYLQHGVFPWWTPNNIARTGFQDLVSDYSRHHPEGFTQLLRELLSKGAKEVMRRISYQIPPEVIQEAVSRWCAPGVMDLHRDLSAVFSSLHQSFPQTFVWDEHYLLELLLRSTGNIPGPPFDRTHYLFLALSPVFRRLGIVPAAGEILPELTAGFDKLRHILERALSENESRNAQEVVQNAGDRLDDLLATISDDQHLTGLSELLERAFIGDKTQRLLTDRPEDRALLREALRRFAAQPQALLHFFIKLRKSGDADRFRQLGLSLAIEADRHLLRLYELSGAGAPPATPVSGNTAPAADSPSEVARLNESILPFGAGRSATQTASALLHHYLIWGVLPDRDDGAGIPGDDAASVLRVALLMLFLSDRQALHGILTTAAMQSGIVQQLATLIHEEAGGTERLLAAYFRPYEEAAIRLMFIEESPQQLIEIADISDMNVSLDDSTDAGVDAPDRAGALLRAFMLSGRMPQLPAGSGDAMEQNLVDWIEMLYAANPQRLLALFSLQRRDSFSALRLRALSLKNSTVRAWFAARADELSLRLAEDLMQAARSYGFDGPDRSAFLRWWSSQKEASGFLLFLKNAGLYSLVGNRFPETLEARAPQGPISDSDDADEIAAFKVLTGFDGLTAQDRGEVDAAIARERLGSSPQARRSLDELSQRIIRAIATQRPDLIGMLSGNCTSANVTDPVLRVRRALLITAFAAISGKQNRPLDSDPVSKLPNRKPELPTAVPGSRPFAPVDPSAPDPFDTPLPQALDKYSVGNAGLILLHPFFPTYFGRLGMLEKGAFRSEADRVRGVQLLQFLATGSGEQEEQQLPLNKLLCGLHLSEPVPGIFEPTEAETKLTAELYGVLFSQWSKMKNSTVDGFRSSFIHRNGMLSRAEEHWTLAVEQRGYDVLLTMLPWAFGMIRTPWMDRFLHVEWPC